jgi:hypothetical protein
VTVICCGDLRRLAFDLQYLYVVVVVVVVLKLLTVRTVSSVSVIPGTVGTSINGQLETVMSWLRNLVIRLASTTFSRLLFLRAPVSCYSSTMSFSLVLK